MKHTGNLKIVIETRTKTKEIDQFIKYNNLVDEQLVR